MSYISILLADRVSTNILFLMLVGALVTSFLIITSLLEITNKTQVILWFFGTGMIYFLLELPSYLRRNGLEKISPLLLVEFVTDTLIILLIWPLLLFIVPLTAYMAVSWGNTALEIEDVLFVAFALFIPQLGSLLIIGIINSKGFFQTKKEINEDKKDNPSMLTNNREMKTIELNNMKLPKN